ncbi:type II restriction endonuclease [Arthrobacter sp. 179]|uniref:type II restriction endonuclease n=1 Tax=Arthrobacter sp. 179 TaxID=3457734 RepID=UPI0040342252
MEDGTLTYYDARANQPKRGSEYRLYYPAHVEAMKRALPGDIVFIAKQKDDTVLLIVAPHGSSMAAQLDWLFGTNALERESYSVRTSLQENQDGLGLPALYLLDMLGIAVEPTDQNWLEQLLEKFGATFPSTAEFGAFTRSTLPDADPRDDPDAVLMAWLEREELLFRTLERHLVTDTLNAVYTNGQVDVDKFVAESLRIHNRRKSRAGKSLEHHLIATFEALGMRHTFDKATENDVRPDFIFPSIEDYHDPSIPAEQLTVLGAKTTCKDRWRQVLSEAERIEHKHLITLESPISLGQTREMQAQKLQLVVPKPLQAPYRAEQQSWLMDLAAFAELTRGRDQTGPTSSLF